MEVPLKGLTLEHNKTGLTEHKSKTSNLITFIISYLPRFCIAFISANLTDFSIHIPFHGEREQYRVSSGRNQDILNI